MTHNELIELSKAAAKVAGVDPLKWTDGEGFDPGRSIWLHEDSARCFELMCRYIMDIESGEVESGGYVGSYAIGRGNLAVELIDTHNNDREQATRVAILKAIVAIGEQK